VSEEVKEAYERGLRDGDIKLVGRSDARAHVRLDKHDVRLSSLERAMWTGIGVWMMVQLLPQIVKWVEI
jgi:hypothetical protein